MSQQDDISYQLETLAIRTGHTRTFEGEHGEPIFLTSSFVYENAAEAAAKFSGQEPGNIYSRFTNPTVAMFEKASGCTWKVQNAPSPPVRVWQQLWLLQCHI